MKMYKALAYAVVVLTLLSFVTSLSNICYFQDGVPKGVIDPQSMKPFVRVGDGYYYFEFGEKVNWFQAQINCRQRHAHLASIETDEEMRALATYLNGKYDEPLWLSGSDLHKVGQYVWTATGEPFRYTKWSVNQPDNRKGVEHCAQLWLQRKNWEWNDEDCLSYQRGYLCEANPPKSFVGTMFVY